MLCLCGAEVVALAASSAVIGCCCSGVVYWLLVGIVPALPGLSVFPGVVGGSCFRNLLGYAV